MTCFSLTKNERLTRGDFRGARWATRSETEHFTFLIHKNKLNSKRIAVTIRKKVGKAVLRNRMRRIIKEYFRLQKDLFLEGYDNMVRVKQAPPKLNMREIAPELDSLLRHRKAHKSINT